MKRAIRSGTFTPLYSNTQDGWREHLSVCLKREKKQKKKKEKRKRRERRKNKKKRRKEKEEKKKKEERERAGQKCVGRDRV
jgi:hypothetical protein